MRLRILVAVPAVLLFLLAGCANGTSGSSGTPVNKSGCPTTLNIAPTDNQKTLCVAVGGTVTVNLQVGIAPRWAPIESNGPALTSTSATTTGIATFTGASVGTTTLTTSRPNCPAASPGTGVMCNSVMAWKVTVQVKS